MIHLRSLTLREAPEEVAHTFPFSVPSIRSLAGQELTFDADVTFFIGENGSGKSTMLEALAIASRAVTVGSNSVERDESLAAVHLLARQLKLAWARRTHRGFFMRSEDFFGYARKLHAMRDEYERELRAIEADPDLSDKARSQARMPYANSLAALRQSYGEGLDNASHGESYFTLFKSRFVPNGLYILDEPEAPLSPMRQIGLLSLMKTMVEEQAGQFIVATHSPLLMAFPNAAIFSFDNGTCRKIAYEDAEHVTLMREFLMHPQRFLRHL